MVSSWPPMSIWTFMLGILLMTNITCQTCDAQQQHHHHHNRYSNKAMLTILDFTLWSYRAEIADFGNPMHKEDGRLKYHATLMIPPANYSQLCQIPDSLTTAAAEVLSDSPTTTLLSYPFDNNTSTENVVEEIANQDATESLTLTPAPGITDAPCQFCGPIALLVSLGGCDAMTKVQVIVDIHQRVTSDLRYIVFYNNDPKDPDNIATVAVSTTLAPLNATSNQQNSTFNPWTVKQQKILDEKLIFVSVSTATGAAILGRMDRLATVTGTSPKLLDPSNNANGYRQWQLPMVLEWVMDASPPGTDPSLTNNDGSGGGGCQNRYDSNDSFYWFRFILFTLLIASPCLRAGYIWWAGGGRIQLRQDPETGRITGLQYIPPMQNWFGIVYHHHHGSQDQTPVHDPLTEEQVMVLPEIAFRLAEANEHNSHCEKTSSEAGKGMHKSSFRIPKDENMIENSKAHNIESTGCHPDNSLVVSNAPMLREETLQLETPNLDSTEISIPPLDVVPINPDALSMIGNATAMSADESLDKEQLPKTNRTSSGGPSSNFTTTTCTTCSICIDEFVDGECLRLLPRCGHAFHTECILPWLSKRQGCCPLCKVAVLATVDSEDKEESCQNGDDAAGSLASSSVQEPANQ